MVNVAGTGNAAKRQKNYTDGPWMSWTEENRAERAIRFIQEFCRLPKGYGAGELMVLTEDQKQWFRDILAPGVSSAIKSCMRGEGKSTEFAALAIWATFDKSESGAPQVPIMATKIAQAVRSVYGVAIKMIQMEPELEDRCTIYTAMGQQRFEVLSTGGECFPIANDPDGLQGLDPSLAIADEIGFQPYESWESLLLASGKRPHSLVVGIGTPGFNRNNALWIIRQGLLENGTSRGVVYREIAAPDGCDWRDEQVWYDCSPALRAGYKNIESIRMISDISSEAHFRIFELGQWVEGADSWLGADGRLIWQQGDTPYVFDPDVPTYVGVDIGVKRDSTAVVILQRSVITGKPHAKCRIWTPQKNKPVDVSDIMQYLREVTQSNNVVAIGYDPRLFEVPSSMLRDEGLPMVEFPQSIERMSPALGELLTAIKDVQITHDPDPIFTTHILNGIPRYNERGFLLSKEKSSGKIDGTIALAIAHDLFLHPVKPKPPLSMWTV